MLEHCAYLASQVLHQVSVSGLFVLMRAMLVATQVDALDVAAFWTREMVIDAVLAVVAVVSPRIQSHAFETPIGFAIPVKGELVWGLAAFQF